MAADSIQGGLAGRSWDALKSWELGAANQPTQAGFMEDVMKLPREDMSTLLDPSRGACRKRSKTTKKCPALLQPLHPHNWEAGIQHVEVEG